MQALAAAFALLPPGLALIPLGFAVGTAVTALVGLVARPRRRTLDGAHWTERARTTYAWGTAMGTAAGMSTSMLAAFVAIRVESNVLSTPVLVTLTGVATLLGGLLAASLCDASRRRERGSPVRRTFGWIALWLLIAPQMLVLVGLACFVDATGTPGNLAVAAAGVVLYALLAAGAGLELARVAGALEPAPPRLEAAIERAGARSGIRPRASFEIALPVTNAFAVPILRWVLFTRSCVELLDDGQLEALACHELAHLGEPVRVQVARVAGSLALLPLGFAPALMGAFGLPIAPA